MNYRLFVATVGLALVHVGAWSAHAQTTTMRGDSAPTEQRPAGWSFTPMFDYAFVYDSNVLYENIGSDVVDEGLHQIKPAAILGFTNRRTQFGTQYNGAFVQHPDLTSLNSYDQRLSLSLQHALTRRTSWFARHTATLTPTTELLELVGVPFTRLGVHHEALRTGVQTTFGRRTDATFSYRLEWVDFKPTLDARDVLNDGHAQGGHMLLRHAMTERSWVTGEYDLTRVKVTNGQFDIQNSWGGVEYQLSEMVRVFGAAGLSRLSGNEERDARVGPSVRLGITRRTERADVGVQFTRSFVPSYSFGGTSDNEELTTRLRLPIARRWNANALVSLRRNQPLALDGFTLRSVWLYGSLGYRLTDWLQLEAFSAGVRQRSPQVDGRINRYQLGFQVTAATTARIR